MTFNRLFQTLLVTAFAASAGAEEPASGVTTASPEEEIVALDDAWIEAEVGGDRAALERILHEDFLATYPSGRTVDRATFIDAILGNPPSPFTVRHESIQVFGDTAVIIDVSETGDMKFTWVAIRRDGRWRAIAETFTRVTPR